jgi:hypothetical protein
MVDVQAYNILNEDKNKNTRDAGELIEESFVHERSETGEFLCQLPPVIEGYDMSSKKWSKFEEYVAV